MRITKAQYEDYQRLLKMEKKLSIRQSARSGEYLVDDIDYPIRRSVAMLALLGCEPLYSCCGFDYEGQPIHKSHQYGNPYIKVKANEHSMGVLYMISKQKSAWVCKTGRGYIDIEVVINGNQHWRAEECIHFSEECIFMIVHLERILAALEGRMLESIELTDTNNLAKQENPYWQYPPKKPWKIFKKDII